MAIQQTYNPQGAGGINLQPGFNPQQAGYGPGFVGPIPVAAPAPAAVAAPRPAVPAYRAPTAAPDYSNPNGFQQFKAGALYGGYNPTNGQAIVFSDINQFHKYFKDFDQNAQSAPFDFTSLLTAPNQVLPIPQSAPAAPAAAAPGSPETPADPDEELARLAAAAGMSTSDYLGLISGKTSATPEQRDQIRNSLGIPALEKEVFSAPSKTTQQLYTDAYNMAGLAEYKTRLTELDKEIAEKKKAFTEAEAVDRENPFLSQASLVGRLGRLSDKRDAELSNLIDEYNSVATTYAQGLSEVNNLVTRSSQDFKESQTLSAQKLQYLLGKADESIADLTSTNSEKVARYLPEFLAAKAKATKPETIGSAETGFFAWDPTEGKFQLVTEPTGPKATGIVAEYEYYARQEVAAGRTPVDFNSYQTMDANRKRSIVNNIIGDSGMNSKQVTVFNGIVDKYNKSPLLAAADRALNLANTVKAVKANPNDGAQQLNMVYQYIGALDNYQTGVKEGELQLVGSLQSKIGAIQNKVNGIANSNKPVDAKTALQIADAAQALIDSINTAAKAKAKTFASQAQVSGVGDAWNQYISAANPSYGGGGAGGSGPDLSDLNFQF